MEMSEMGRDKDGVDEGEQLEEGMRWGEWGEEPGKEGGDEDRMRE